MNGTTRKAKVRRATVFAASLRNLSDAHWDNIIAKAQSHLTRERNNAIPSRDRSGTGSSTLVEDEDELDPDGDFVMNLE